MLELGIGADVVRGIGWIFWGLIALGLGLAVSKPKTRSGKAICAALVLAVPVAILGPSIYRGYEYRKRYAVAKALFDERCKNAGEQIFRVVDDVEGVFLLNVRANDRIEKEADPDWPDAGLPNESSGENYIENFLKWEDRRDPRNPRGALGYASSEHPGYHYVDIKEEGVTWRYTLRQSHVTGQFKLEKTEQKGPPARYAVKFTNLLDPEGRKYWVAGTTVGVVDTQTSELLAQATWYSFEPGQGSTAGARQPWRFAQSCPTLWGGQERAPTRFFVDQVLVVKQGE